MFRKVACSCDGVVGLNFIGSLVIRSISGSSRVKYVLDAAAPLDVIWKCFSQHVFPSDTVY